MKWKLVQIGLITAMAVCMMAAAPMKVQSESKAPVVTTSEEVTIETNVEPIVTQSLDQTKEEEIQELTTEEIEQEEEEIIIEEPVEPLYSADYFEYNGVIDWNGYHWTWYSEQVLPGGGLEIPGRHGDENGYICDEEDYICLASSTLEKGTVIDTPFGKQGKIYDCGCEVGTIDVYVNW